MRKLISVICAFLCLAAFIPRAAADEGGDYHTADGYGYTLLDDGTALVTMYPVVSRTVTIPDVLDGIPVTAVGPAAFDNDQEKETIRHIVIADGVLRVARNAFDGFSKLTYVTLPDSVTEIGEGAFRSCRGLKSVRLPAGLKAIGAEAFDACGLTSVVFPDGLETIGSRAFDCCTLRELTFPASVRSIGDEAFRTNGRLTLKKVTFLGTGTVPGDGIFGYLYAEDGKTLDAYSAPLPSVLKIPSLTVICPPGSTADRRFQFNVKKQYPKWDETHTRSAPADRVLKAGLYSAEDQVYELVIPEGVEEIADNAFAGLPTLCRVFLPSSLKKIGKNAFSGCFALEAVRLPEGLASLGEGCFSGCWSLREVSIPAGIEKIPDRAFADCFRLSELTFPEGLTEIGEDAFSQDTEITDFLYTAYEADDHFCALKAVKLPASLQVLGRAAFRGNDALTSVAFPPGSRLTVLADYAFSGCVRLKQLELPDGLLSIGEGAFMDAHSLTALTVPDSVKEIGGSVLEGCPLNIAVTCRKGGTMDKYLKRYENGSVYSLR